jgi:ketosteroid isomerase-like protein
MAWEHQDQHASQWAAITSIAEKKADGQWLTRSSRTWNHLPPLRGR